MTRIWRTLGCISGTSMDGIDVAALATDGGHHVAPGAGRTYPYPADLAEALRALIRDPARAETDPLADLETAVTDAHVTAIERFMADEHVARADIDLVGCHGQTVWHNPAQRFTRQLFDGARAATRLGIDVVARFRHADVAAGGQGAPLAPLYHQALTARLDHPVMVLNLGGVANVTYIDGETIIAFDTGPASALLDDWMRRRRRVAFDADGALARSGRVDAAVLAQLMADPYFALAPPKSLDRQAFAGRVRTVEPLSDADGAATLAAFTVASIAAALAHVPKPPRRWLVAGGGRNNRALMLGLAAKLGVPVVPIESQTLDGDALEAQLFGYLAVRSVRGLPLSLPTTTGVPQPVSGGVLYPARP